MKTDYTLSHDDQETLDTLLADLHSHINPAKAAFLPRFFKTGPGQYGDGDKFLGIVVPDTRKIVKLYRGVSRTIVNSLLESEWHEERLCGLLLLVDDYEQAEKRIRKQYKTSKQKLSEEQAQKEVRAVREDIAAYYLSKSDRINNWDLVDLSAWKIIGREMLLLEPEDRTILYDLSKSDLLWEQRIAIVSTFGLIRDGQLEDTMKLLRIYLNHTHDLMHKACGWMMREVAKRDQELVEVFLEEFKDTMPRTMLRYAIEKFSPEQRDYFMGRTDKKG